MDPLDPSCPMDVHWTSNGRPLDMMSIGKIVRWCLMDPTDPFDPFPMFNGHVHWPMHPMDVQWIHYLILVYPRTSQQPHTCIKYTSQETWVDPKDIITNPSLSIGSIKHHWTCPLDPMDPLCPLDPLNTTGHVHWIQWIHCTLCLLDPLCSLCPLDPLDPVDILCNGSDMDMSNGVKWSVSG